MRRSRFSQELVIGILKEHLSALLRWQQDHGVGWLYIGPGAPVQKGWSTYAHRVCNPVPCGR